MSSTSPEHRRRTRIIAHRGASGYLPEHTALAKAMAYGLGADFIEQDVVATRDRQLVVLHDVYLDDVSDVAARYPGRRRNGRFHVVDFTFEELSTLTLLERREPHSDRLRYPGRFPYVLREMRISLLEDEIRLVAGLNASTGRQVGIYPEIKDPEWHTEADIDLTQLMADTLNAAADLISGPVFVQSFDQQALERLSRGQALPYPLIQLLDRAGAESLLDDAHRLSATADYAAGIGLPFQTLIEVGPNGRLQPSRLAARLADSDLLLHPYTLRRDVPPGAGIDYFAALRFLIHELEVDAVFCDHPDDALRVRDYNGA